jgi:hypothetical protein
LKEVLSINLLKLLLMESWNLKFKRKGVIIIIWVKHEVIFNSTKNKTKIEEWETGVG